MFEFLRKARGAPDHAAESVAEAKASAVGPLMAGRISAKMRLTGWRGKARWRATGCRWRGEGFWAIRSGFARCG